MIIILLKQLYGDEINNGLVFMISVVYLVVCVAVMYLRVLPEPYSYVIMVPMLLDVLYYTKQRIYLRTCEEDKCFQGETCPTGHWYEDVEATPEKTLAAASHEDDEPDQADESDEPDEVDDHDEPLQEDTTEEEHQDTAAEQPSTEADITKQD